MYRKPRTSVTDRHILIELDGDYMDYEMEHLLRKAYENHKAPHEYDDIKKYIRDMVIGKHNSVCPQAGTPVTIASATVLMPSNTLNWSLTVNGLYQGIPYNSMGNDGSGCYIYLHSSCASTPSPFGYGLPLITYNNGTGIGWVPVYSNTLWCNGTSGTNCPSSGILVIAQSKYSIYSNTVNPSSLYAPYTTSTNPLTLTTYYSWTYPSSSSAASYSYVIFTLLTSNINGPTYYSYIFLFYSSGTYSFSPGTQYITEWQFTYN